MCETPVNGTWDGSETEGQFEPKVQPTEYKEKGTFMRLKRGLLKEGFHCEKQTDCRQSEYSLEVFFFGMKKIQKVQTIVGRCVAVGQHQHYICSDQFQFAFSD